MTLAAVVFDCDGTIADTESLAERAWSELLGEAGYRPTADDFAAIIGRSFMHNWQHFRAHVDLGDAEAFVARLRARYTELFAAGLDIYLDAVATIRDVASSGRAVAVASSSRHRHVIDVLERAGIAGIVDVVIGADDVARHKPDPLPYARAVDLLGVPAEHTTAVEDTAVGIASATAAGLFTVAVHRRGGAHELSGADRVVTQLTLDALHPNDVGT
ncbi:MAG: HAD family phosphatase [Nitriliruptoraceae bacterium]